MKIFIASRGKNKLSEMSEKFGKTENFVIYDTETKEYNCLENTNRLKEHGAGVNTLKEILLKGADVLIAKKIGEKSLEMLKHSNLQVFEGKGRYVYEEIESYLNGELSKIEF